MFKRSLLKFVRLSPSSPFSSYPSFLTSPLPLPQNVHVQLMSLTNDSTGSLVASRYVNPRTKASLVLGTGFNAAYMEQVGGMGKMGGMGIEDEAEMAVNTELVSAPCAEQGGSVSTGLRFCLDSVRLIRLSTSICLGPSMTGLSTNRRTSLVNKR
jgi:hypothetical protein